MRKAKKSIIKKSTRKNLPAIVEQPPAKQLPMSIDIDPQALLQTAISNNAAIDAIEKLLDLRDRLKKEQAEIAYREAMSAFQAKCPIIPKSKAVLNKDKTSTRYKYAPIDRIIKAVSGLISEHGFSYNTKTEVIENPFKGVRVTVVISHIAGHSEMSSFDCAFDQNEYMTEQQRWLSTTTFAKRIAFCNGFGIMTGDEDNDTNNPQKEEEDKRTKEAIEKLKSLPENIRKGFEILGYKFKAQWEFCNIRDWNNERIYADINKLVDQNA